MFQKRSEKKKRKLILLVLRQKKSDRPARKCFRCGSVYHLIAKCHKPPKDGEKKRKSDKSKAKGNSEKDNSDDDNDLKVYASMA